MWRAFGKPFLNINKIFPTKQKYVAQMIDVCKNNPNVKKLLFSEAVLRLAVIHGAISIFILKWKTNLMRIPQ